MEVGLRIAVVSDVHGNDMALEAVLKHAATAGYDRLFDLGDTVSGPLRPVETFDRMRFLDAISIAGNHERQLLTLPPDRLNATDAFTRTRLGAARLDTLRGRKPTLRIDDILLVHGSPSSDLDYLLEDVAGGQPVARVPADVAAMTASASDGVSLILCGHTHISRAMLLERGPLVVNPGSVGLPAYDEPDCATPHRMEAGTPHARYAMVTRTPRGWSVAFHLVDYNWKTAATNATRAGRHD
jgi:predicted phosphodiesterase